MKTIIFLLTIISFSTSIFSYPIEPVPLRELVTTSEFIIIGYVRTFTENENNFYFHDKAAIEIKEVLQGKLIGKEIILNMDIDLLCPAPAMYYDSTYALAFLNRNSKGELYTNSLSYGSKTLSLSEIEVYKSRIVELQNILTIKDEIECEGQIVEWLIKCAENSVTRWEGIYELAPKYVPFHLDKYLFVPSAFPLTDIQEQKLRNIFLSIDIVNYSDLGLIDIFLLSDSSEVKEWLSQKLKNKKYSSDFVASELKDRIYFINNDKKRELKRRNG